MFLGDNDTASKMIDTTEAIASPEEKDDLIVLKASLASAQGDYANAIKLASQSQSSTAAEIAALCSYQEDRDTGVALIERFLESSSSNKVPRVVEDCGLRYTGPMGHMDSVLEPSLTETVLQSMFAHNLSYKNETTALGDSNIVMGAVGVGPQGNIDGLAGSGDVVVTTSVDDHLVGMVNSSPYRITWDTRKVSNGKHVLKFDISNVAGTVLQTQYKKLTVANPGAEALATSAPFSEQLEEQLWGLLKIHPAYKAAEWTLYSAYNNRRDRNHSETHLIVAAALDSAYHDSGAKVEDLFRNSSYGKLMVASSQLIKIVSNKKNEFWRGSQNLKEVALTFDDGPSPLVSPTLLDNLKRANAPGTFFVVGIRCTAAPDLVSRMHNEGHEVENHTYSHPNLDQAIPQHIMEEYLRNGVIIHSLTGRWPRFLRPPGGNSNPYVMSIAQKCGMIGGFWTVDAIRAEDTGSPQQVANYVIQKARPGAIILMHNGDQATANAIPELVAGLKAKGFKCVTLSQLARDSGVSLP
jgi:peptidoglycan/xylan/chitin deacetylase (PgdA/CDA1 family)